MKSIRFKHGMSPYQAGETASFEDAYADKIIKMGYAEEVKQESAYTPKTTELSQEKAKEAPPVDKMVRGAKTKTKKPSKK